MYFKTVDYKVKHPPVDEFDRTYYFFAVCSNGFIYGHYHGSPDKMKDIYREVSPYDGTLYWLEEIGGPFGEKTANEFENIPVVYGYPTDHGGVMYYYMERNSVPYIREYGYPDKPEAELIDMEMTIMEFLEEFLFDNEFDEIYKRLKGLMTRTEFLLSRKHGITTFEF